MALFSKKNQEKEKEKNSSSEVTKPNKSSAKAKQVVITPEYASIANVLLRPMITEKAHAMQEKGQYAFYVGYETTKLQIKEAVERVYSVHVTSVSTAKIKPKKRIRGRTVGYTKRMKKAIVSLRSGESIMLFE